MKNTHARHQLIRAARRGFTLLEIIVVVTIIALLATLVAPRLLTNIAKAKQKVARSEVASLQQQFSLYLADNGMTKPTDDMDLNILVPNYIPNTDGLKDPWGREYILLVPGESGSDFDIVSYGSNGEPGGDGEDKDVNSNIKE